MLPAQNAISIYSAPSKPAAVPAWAAKGATEFDCATGKLIPCAIMVMCIANKIKAQCATPAITKARNSALEMSDTLLPIRNTLALEKRVNNRRQIMVPSI